MYTKVLSLIKLLLIISVITHGILNLSFNYGMFLFSCLFFLLNNSIRYIIKNKKVYILSLFMDIILCITVDYFFNGSLVHLLLLITISDSMEYMKSYIYPLSFFIASVYIYILGKKNTEIIIVNLILLISFSLLSYIIRVLKSKNDNLEFLYDDVRRYSYELEKAKMEIEEYSKKVEELTSLQERSSIASEIHDTIGHKLTALLIQMEAAVRISSVDVEKSKELMSSSLQNLRESIEILRQTVHNIRPVEYSHLLKRIENLIDKLKKDTNIDVGLSVTGQPFQISPGVELVIYKNIQECITNSLKHGKADIIKIELIYSIKEINLKVIDNGIGCEKVNFGMGLNGMKNRTSFVGGKLEIYSKNGFIVETNIPIE
ncbi:sensor histidine kinase [Clostridium sediminicola]|uniref:sensor histidine kinase n=1 Tax=Clostridium sediminicola TaxID=3114879 RepID=UPI0031F2799A